MSTLPTTGTRRIWKQVKEAMAADARIPVEA
jgi:hypothetical protein